MVKYSRNLGDRKRQELLGRFVQALASLKSEERATAFLEDLLTRQEVAMLSRRLAIADRLIVGARYADIIDELKVSSNTIARVHSWLESSGVGFRYAHHTRQTIDLSRRQRRRPTIYNWPVVLMEEVLASGSTKQRARIRRLVEKLDAKSELYEELSGILSKLRP